MPDLSLLKAREITVGHGRAAPVLRNVSLSLGQGEIVGLSGPSGCGKTTLGRVLSGLHVPRAGAVTLGGAPLPKLGACPVQYVAQNPLATMNPRWKIGRIIAEGLDPGPDMAARLGVEPGWSDRFPHELSGGQLQRVALLRALAVRPSHLILDEISASLDAIAQARLWNCLRSLAQTAGIGMLAISHDRVLLDLVADEVRELSFLTAA